MEGSATPKLDPANRIGVDYRAAAVRKVAVPIVDVHTHLHGLRHAAVFFEAADHFGVETVFSMSPLEDVPALRAAYGARLRFIAIPRWKDMQVGEDFRRQWMHDLGAFRDHGAMLCKLWMAPRMRGDLGLTLDHEFLAPVVERAVALGYRFMVHIGDPSVWWGSPGSKYADTAKFGTKDEQYPPFERFLERVAPRLVIAAHMGGSVERPEFLAELLERHPNLMLDSSATKWIVREVARRPAPLRDFMLRHSDRVLFGSDLVAREPYDAFDHYASRYWCHWKMWESDYQGESPIDDPDADGVPRLAGLALPPDVLQAMYRGNAHRLGLLD